MVYAILAGGVGAARFLRGLVRVAEPRDITVIVNVGDDIQLHGLHVSPDLDTLTYTLAGVVDPEQGWGRANETFHVSQEVARYGEPTWFTLGDHDLGTHLVRTHWLRQGRPLSAVTAAIATAWNLDVRLLPATDDPVATRVRTADGRCVHFQEYWVRDHAADHVVEVSLAGAEKARPAPGVTDAIRDADAVVISPSNPVVSIGTILAVPGIRDALEATDAPVVGVSPVVGGAVVRGMADRLLPAVGADVSAHGVAAWYGQLLDGWVIDEADRDLAGAIEDLGVAVEVTDTLMDDVAVATALAQTTLELARSLR
ncbi:MAG: 2-phospho-L-lactate transferase [Actinomycetota bacterium]|nr:2-phospho-L-lactate transferase [Actinomycetota bacterium]